MQQIADLIKVFKKHLDFEEWQVHNWKYIPYLRQVSNNISHTSNMSFSMILRGIAIKSS